MSAQLFNPKSKKLVNVDPKQIPVLMKAGWLSPSDEKVSKLKDEKANEEEVAELKDEKAKEEKEAAIEIQPKKNKKLKDKKAE